MSNIDKQINKMKTLFILLSFLFLTGNTFSQNSPQQTFDNGLEAFYDGRFQDGIKFFTEYISTNNTDFKGYTYRGLCFQAMKNYPRDVLIEMIKDKPEYKDRVKILKIGEQIIIK